MAPSSPAPPLRRDLDRLRKAHATVAKLTADDPVYVPIFLRLEEDLQAAEAALLADPVLRARAVARQSAMLRMTA